MFASHPRHRPSRSKGYAFSFDSSSQRRERPSLQSLDGPDGLVDDQRHLLHREVADDPQDEYFALVVRQLGAQFVHATTADDGERVLFGVAADPVEDLVAGRGRRPVPDGTPTLVDQPAMSNREDPGAELLFGALEGAQPREDTEEGLAGEVLGFGRALQAQVAGDGRGEVSIETLESPRRARARRVEDLVEPFADRQSEPPSLP